MNDVIVNLIMQDEGPRRSEETRKRWTLHLVVHGIKWQVGPMVDAYDEQDAAAKFAALLIPAAHPVRVRE